MVELEEKKGGLDNIQQRLCKVEDSFEKTLTSLNYIREPKPQECDDEATKAETEGTIPSIVHTVDRLQRLADNMASTLTAIRYG